MIPLGFIPSVPTLVIVAALSIAVGVQQVRVDRRDAALAAEVAARATETAERAGLALDHALTVGRLQSQHAALQQLKEDEYAQQLHNNALAGAAGRADAQRLRDKLATFTSGDRQPGEADTAACQRAQHRLPIVGALLGEGVGLEAESRAIIEQRDAEVARLLAQINVDRAACSAP